MTPALPPIGAGRRRPAWLATPGRLAGIGRRGAQAWLAITAVPVLAALVAARLPAADPIDGTIGAAIADGVRHGGDVYAVVADAAHALSLPASVRAIPLPTLPALLGRVPAPLALLSMMLLAVLVVLAWYARFGSVPVGRRARAGALLLMLVGMAVALRPSLVAVPEGWAGLLVALSLARAAPGQMVERIALGVAAAMLSAAALPYPAVMALFAWHGRAGREAAGWTAVLLAGALVLALHARALGIVAPGVIDPANADGLGLVDTVAAFGWATGLRASPLGLALPLPLPLPLAVLAFLGWASRREPVAAQVTALIVAQGALVAALAMPDAALVVAPLLPLGLLALPDAVRDLVRAALDRRRVTVTRLVR